MNTQSLRCTALVAALALSLAACGGGGSKSASPSPETGTGSPAPGATVPSLTGPANFTVSGTIGPGIGLAGARISAYDSAGKACGTPVTADNAGKYTLSAKCVFPIVLFADVPDGNDTEPPASEGSGEGRKYFNFISDVTKDGQAFQSNLTPVTAASTLLVLGHMPTFGSTYPRSILNEARRADAQAKITQALDVFAPALGLTSQDYFTADVSPGSSLASLLAIIQVSFERIDSTKQTLIRLHAPSEHRPVVLTAIDGKPISEAYFDSGLGIAPTLVDTQALTAAQKVHQEIQDVFATNSTYDALPLDSCFLHNGSTAKRSLFDVPNGWAPAFTSSFENVSLLRLNTYSDFSNETLEQRNTGAATLAFIAFDFRNKHSLKQRAYTWLIKGSQGIQGCESAGGSWRILGNQRQVYVRTDSIAVHETLVSQQFGSRRDTYGSGTEHYIADSAVTPYTHALVTGPGLPSDGVVFVKLDHSFLYSTTSLLKIRAGALSKQPDWFKAIVKSVQDTRAVMMTDPQVRQISDAYFDAQQNKYTYRFFSDYVDLYPTTTLVDVLPKRPYLATELPVTYFHSVAVNYDNLIQALQRSDPVVLNWSLPLDLRKKQMLPEQAWFSRMNCRVPKMWPKCIERADQFNEYDLGTEYFSSADTAAVTLVPPLLPNPPVDSDFVYTTFKGYARVRLLDSLNRPIETRVGMDYTR